MLVCFFFLLLPFGLSHSPKWPSDHHSQKRSHRRDLHRRKNIFRQPTSSHQVYVFNHQRAFKCKANLHPFDFSLTHILQNVVTINIRSSFPTKSKANSQKPKPQKEPLHSNRTISSNNRSVISGFGNGKQHTCTEIFLPWFLAKLPEAPLCCILQLKK